MRGRAGRGGRCAGDARGCAVEGADGAATAELSRESSESLRGVEKSSLYCNIWSLGARRAVGTFRVLSVPRVYSVHSKSVVSYHTYPTKSPIQSPYPSAPIHKHSGKLGPQAQDADTALRPIAAPSAPSTAHPLASPAHRPPRPARP